MSAKSKITAARVSLVLEAPFFGVLTLSLKVVEDNTQPTAWTDGRSLGYNSQFIESLNHEQVKALWAHEVLHNGLGHPWRRDGRSFLDWNRAADLAINGQLKDAGFTLPPDGLMPNAEQVGKSAEWIFARIHQSEKPNGNAPGQGQGPSQGNQPGQDKPDPLGEVRDAPTSADADGTPAPSEQDWKQKVTQALAQAKAQGNMSGGMERLVKEALKPRIDIRALLLRFFSERSTGDFTWTRPNTRFLAHNLYLPSLYSQELGEVAIMVDTSGSVNETSLAHARAVVESVIQECSPAAVTVIYADAKVCRTDRFEKGEPLVWQPKGGGGTDFSPALAAIEDEGTAVCAVCITDLMGRFPESCSVPTLWLATTDRIAPFGETVPLEV